jgi:molybdopterin-biosynthesis enzyme MoeA-like protein
MAIVLQIIGDEILSGKRQDKHFRKVIDLLAARGMALDSARIVGDGREQIAESIAAAIARGDVLLSCGGIGATPDDQTRQAAALALGVAIERHPAAERLILDNYGDKALPNRVLMADFPAGAELIPNPVNRVAGFSIGNCYFVPGFPEMAWPMLEWVLDTKLKHLHQAQPPVEYSLRALGPVAEGDLLPLMEQVLQLFPGVKLSSLPSRGDAKRARHIEFGIKGQRDLAAGAYTWFREHLASNAEIQIEELSKPA